jgi:ABC-type multidrug transport system permease subunit
MRHLKTNDKWIWLIIPLQILWANLHEAFAIGIVVSSIFTIASFVDALLKKESQKQTAVLLAAITILSIVCIIINPNGIDLLVRPLAIFGQLEANKYTTELFSISSYKYWTKEAWIGLFFFVATDSVL